MATLTTLPQALMDLITDRLVIDEIGEDRHQANFQERKVRLSATVCACGSGGFKLGPRECTNGENRNLGGQDQGCYAMNQSELSSPRDAAMFALNTS